MILEIGSTLVMGGIALTAHLKKSGATNDSGKIQKIFQLSGLSVKDGKQTYTTQLVKRKEYSWGMEYRYRIPLGRSFSDYVSKLPAIEDGLNNRRMKLTLRDLRTLRIDSNLIHSIKTLWSRKLTAKKEIELSYDGMLILRVYNEPLPKHVPFQAGTDWKVPVGLTREKNQFLWHDFEKVPHMALGGATRYGKSNYINSVIVSLLRSQPENVRLYLIDLKGGVELCDYENCIQTVAIAYEPNEAEQVLKQAYEEMRAVQQKLRKLGKKNVQEAGIKQRHFIIIDEVGELNPDEAVDKKDIRVEGMLVHKSEKSVKEQCQTYMSQIARLGAGLGFRQILATQYPTGDVIPRQCKQNSDAKLCFRVQNGTASRVVLDSEGAEQLPEVKGRAIFQTSDKRMVVQTPLITSQLIKETIEPYIVFKEEIEDETPDTETGSDSFVFEKTGLS